LQDTLKQSGVVTGNSYTNQYKPSPIQVYESTKLDLGTKSKRPTFLDEVENRKKYENEIKTANAQNLIKEIETQRNVAGFAGYEYKKQKVNDENVTLYDKTLGNITRGIGSLFDIGDQVRDEHGNLYSLPSYNELKQQKVNESYNTNIGKILGNVTYEGTRILSTSILNKVTLGAGGSALYYSDMFKNSYDQAMRDGYDNDSSVLYASLGTLTEFATGKFLGSATKGLTGGKTSELSKGLQKGFDKLINNRGLSNFLANATSEGIEEFTQEYLDNFNKLLTLEKEKNPNKYLEVITNPEVLSNAMYSAGVGALTGGVLNIPSSITLSKVNNDNLKQKNYNKNIEQDVNIFNLGKNQQKVSHPIAINQNISQTNLNQLNSNYQYIQSNNPKINALNESASRYFDNSETTKKLLDTYSKIIQDKNYNILFDATITNGKSNKVNAQIKTLPNGETEIRVNPNSNRAGEFLIMHEVTHAIETNSMKELVLDYASKNPEFNQALASLKQTYGTDDISSEVLADISGQLFGNQEFINNLSMEKPNIFKKIYNSIISLANKIIGNSKEGLFFKDLKNKWENAYRSQSNNLSNIKYSFIGEKGIKNAVKQDSTNIIYQKALEEAKLKQQTGQYSNEELRKKYNWFQDELGNWIFELPDNESDFVKDFDKMQNKKLKISDIYNHHDLFEAYPKLKKYSVEIKSIPVGKDKQIYAAEVSPITNKITLNSDMLKLKNGKEILRKSMLHEMQHIIQKIENFEKGDSAKDLVKYYTSLGEIMSSEVEERSRMTFYDLRNNAPEISKNNPIHPDIRKTIENPNLKGSQQLLNQDNVAELVKKAYNRDKGEYNRARIHKKGIEKDFTTKKNILFQSGNESNQGNTIQEELENSSFSMQKNSEWKNYLEENYKSTGIKTEMNQIKLPTTKNKKAVHKDYSKIMNPNEISQLTKEDANMTPVLPKIKRNNKYATEESSFYKNITEKSKFLTEENRKAIENEKDVQYYKGITNKDTLNEAKSKLDNGGMSETLNWFNRNKFDSEGKAKHNPTAVDVAEGWILLKQYQDAGDYDSMIEVAKTMREIGTQAGQTVQAYNIMARLTPEGMIKYAQSELSEAYERMSKNKTKEWIDSNRDKFDLTAQEVQSILEIMENVQNMEDGYNKKVELAKIQKIMTDKLPPEQGAGIKTWMRISMLFNPKTQVRNFMGNAVMTPVNYFSDLFSSVIDNQIAKKTGYRTTGVTNIGNYVKGFKKGAFESYNDFKNGINTRNIEGNRFEIGKGKSFDDRNLIGRNLNKVDHLLGFMLDAGDRTFYEATFTNSINNQLKLNKTETITQEMIDIATQEALSRTWQDNNNYTKFVLNIRKGLNAIHIPGKKGYGLGDILIPFAKTPANLTKAIVDYSPLGLIQTINDGMNLKKSLRNGQYTTHLQHKFVQDLGKATAGTMLYVLGYALAKSGIASGESDEDKDVANFLKNTLGVSSYSIKIGDKSFTYDWAQPVAAPIAMMTNLVQKQKESKNLAENITAVLDTGLNVIFEQSFLESLSNVLSESGEIGTKLGEQFLELPSRAIPTLSKQIADLVDGTQRTTFEKDKPLETAFNKVKVKIPGLSKTVAPTVDTMGREIQKYGGKNNLFNVFINPANVNTENISESAKAIYDVYKATKDKTILPRTAPYSISSAGKTYIFYSKDRTEFQKISGKIIEDNVKKLEKNNEYQKMSAEDKSEAIKGIVDYAYNKAKKEITGIEMAQTFNKVNEWLERGGNLADYYSNKEENNYSLENPEKYLTINSFKIDYDNYEKYRESVSQIKKTYSGENNSKTRKKQITQYINSLPLDKYQKIILMKEIGGYSIISYKNEMYQYINSMGLTKKEKQEIWNQLYE